MNDRNVVEIEPSHNRLEYRATTERPTRKVELADVAGHELLLLASCTARAFLDGYEMRARLKNRRIAMMITGALFVAFGIGELVVQLFTKS